MSDIKDLIALLPDDIHRIVGIARSGLSVATHVAMALHLPLYIARQSKGDIVEGGNGWRLYERSQPANGRTLLIDDTVMSGNSMNEVRPIVERRFGETVTAAIYVNPLGRFRPDFCGVDLAWPHLLEWNLFNSVHLPQCAFDFDGILCHDCPVEDDDDGPRYQQFLHNVKPLYLVRKRPIPLIVTARLEKYRDFTEDWLKRWGMQAERLVMGPWHNLAERRAIDVAAYKAKHFEDHIQKRGGGIPQFFIESNEYQARRIAQLTKGIVVCPQAGRCFA
ncbi:MAG: hypothetical protein KDA66_04385 [Planctomycetaceae bacterium]|nr:hypothetical protein [Planctomycetaceae bacterium]